MGLVKLLGNFKTNLRWRRGGGRRGWGEKGVGGKIYALNPNTPHSFFKLSKNAQVHWTVKYGGPYKPEASQSFSRFMNIFRFGFFQIAHFLKF